MDTTNSYKYSLKNNLKDANVKHYKMPEYVEGNITGNTKLDAMINLIKTNKDIREFLYFKYYADYATLEEMFCDPLSEYKNSLERYYKWIEKNEIEFDSKRDEFEFINNNKLLSDIFSKYDFNNLTTYYGNLFKYEKLIGAFWCRSFEENYSNIDDECLKQLASKEIRDGNIRLL